MARGKTPAATDTAATAGTVDAVASADEPPDDLPDHLFRWSDAVAQRLSREMRALAPAELLAVGGRRARLLQMVPTAGMRVTDLAHRAGVTKQAVSDMQLRMKQQYQRATGGRAQFAVVSGKGPRTKRTVSKRDDNTPPL